MSREQMKVIAVDDSCYLEAPGSVMVRRNIERGSGIGTMQTGTGTPKQKITSGLLVPVPWKLVPIPQSNKSSVA